jgi:hypothetical protein
MVQQEITMKRLEGPDYRDMLNKLMYIIWSPLELREKGLLLKLVAYSAKQGREEDLRKKILSRWSGTS